MRYIEKIIIGGIEVSKEPCIKKTLKETLKEIFLTSWAFVAYAAFFSWFSIGWLAAQIWRFGGLSFTLSTLDLTRLVVGCIGLFVCVFVVSKWHESHVKNVRQRNKHF